MTSVFTKRENYFSFLLHFNFLRLSKKQFQLLKLFGHSIKKVFVLKFLTVLKGEREAALNVLFVGIVITVLHETYLNLGSNTFSDVI